MGGRGWSRQVAYKAPGRWWEGSGPRRDHHRKIITVVGERGSPHESCLQPVPGCLSRLEACRPVKGDVDGGGVVAALGPGPLPAVGVDGLSSADLTQQLLRAVLVEQRE
jgi:hypothetical protein